MENTHIHSEEITELIGRPPKVLVRSGTTVISLIVISMLAASYFIKYPEVIHASLILHSEGAPKRVYTNADGKLIKLLVNENAVVETGDQLAFIEAVGNHDQVLLLEKILASPSPVFEAGAFGNLGELQTAFQQFSDFYTSYLLSGQGQFYTNKAALLKDELSQLNRLTENLLERKTIIIEDIKIARQELSLQQKLFEQNVISQADYRREESKCLQKSIPLKDIEHSLIVNNTSILEKKLQLMELEKSVMELHNRYMQELQILRNAISSWKRQYILVAPIAGRIQFPFPLQEKLYVKAGTELFSVVSQSNEYVGIVRGPQYNFGKIRSGQKVLIKFNSFPYQEYGQVTGAIVTISKVPLENGDYTASVSLPREPVTNFGKNISYFNGMEANAEIITEDARLIERLIYDLRKIFKDLN